MTTVTSVFAWPRPRMIGVPLKNSSNSALTSELIAVPFTPTTISLIVLTPKPSSTALARTTGRVPLLATKSIARSS